MKKIITGSTIALLLMIASPAAAEVGGTITRQAPATVTLNTLLVAVLDLFTWESATGSIDFTENNFTATAGCNNISGSFAVDRTTINFGEPISTLMFCEGKMDAEAALVSTLDTATNITFKDGKLVLSNGTSSAAFTPKFNNPAASTSK